MDRLYTSMPLANWLFDFNITNVGTLNLNHTGIPYELKNPKDKEEFSGTCHFKRENRNLCPSSYTMKSKSKGKKNVLFLSTVRPMRKKTGDDHKKSLPYIRFMTLVRAVQILWIK